MKKNLKAKSLKRKSLRRKSLKRKSLKRKSLKRKSLKRKSLKNKSLGRKSYSPEAIAAYTGTVLGLGALGASIYSINKNIFLQDQIKELSNEKDFLNAKINQIAINK